MVALWLCVTAGAASAQQCRIRIQGESVTKLVLVDNERRLIEFVDPGSEVSLPAGRYGLYEIHVQDGYLCGRYASTDEDWFTLTPKRPYELKIGGPLTPAVKVRRLGRNLTLHYELSDAAGRYFFSQEKLGTPQFSIYQGERIIHSGYFEYG